MSDQNPYGENPYRKNPPAPNPAAANPYDQTQPASGYGYPADGAPGQPGYGYPQAGPPPAQPPVTAIRRPVRRPMAAAGSTAAYPRPAPRRPSSPSATSP